jgi:hypothetical protein
MYSRSEFMLFLYARSKYEVLKKRALCEKRVFLCPSLFSPRNRADFD